MMDNAEDVMHSLEEFSKLKPKVIPRELEDYLGYVAKTGDPVFKWCMVKYLFREKMLSVINDFYEDTLTIDLPPCPNVDAFNYDRMKTSLLERLESFHGAPFTIQRICELLTNPRKEYNRADKFMRAIEKNILVVSTREPGRYSDLDCETTQECPINGIREVGDSLDSTFIINDLGPGPDSSSPSLQSNDPTPDANHLNTVERVSPVHDQEASSDSDENSLENGHLAADGPDGKTDGLNAERIGPSAEEHDGADVSSTDMSLSLEDSGEMRCDESPGNSVSSTHESVISERPVSFVASPNLGQVVGSDRGAPADNLEPRLLAEGSPPDQVVDRPPTHSAKDSDETESISEIGKSDEIITPEASEQSSDPLSATTSMSIIVSVECDTSEKERNLENDDPTASTDDAGDGGQVSGGENDQIACCDTTGAVSTIQGAYIESSRDRNSLSPQCRPHQLDAVSGDVPSDGAQPGSVCQSQPVSQAAPEETAAPDNSSPSGDSAQELQDTNSSECDYVSPSHSEDRPEVSESDQISQAEEKTPEFPSQAVDSIQPNVEDLEPVSSEVADVSSGDRSQSIVEQVIDGADQSCVVASSEELVASTQPAVVSPQPAVVSPQPAVESMINTNDLSSNECLDNDNEAMVESQPSDQTQQVVQMDIPSDSEPTSAEPAQSTQLDSNLSEPMDVDE